MVAEAFLTLHATLGVDRATSRATPFVLVAPFVKYNVSQQKLEIYFSLDKNDANQIEPHWSGLVTVKLFPLHPRS